MIALLLVVTFAALAIAGVLAAYVIRLTREERDRSEARAAALADALGADRGESPAVLAPPIPVGSASTRSSLEAPTDELPAPDPDLFGSALPRAGSPRLLLIPIVGIVVVGLAVSGLYLWNRPSASATPPVQAGADAAAPLELMALRHARQGDTLIISGLVRNPDAGHAVTGLTAVAFAFDRQGRFLTSGRATIDFPQLIPGDESPFSVTLPDASDVGRYRISFRNEAGILPHLDRRSEATAPAQEVSAR
jgi:hypothetical protein